MYKVAQGLGLQEHMACGPRLHTMCTCNVQCALALARTHGLGCRVALSVAYSCRVAGLHSVWHVHLQEHMAWVVAHAHTHTHTLTHTHTHTHTQTNKHAHLHMCSHGHTRAHTWTHTSTHTHLQTHAHLQTYAHTCSHMPTHAHAHTHMHMHHHPSSS
jgi:hypothetical protein